MIQSRQVGAQKIRQVSAAASLLVAASNAAAAPFVLAYVDGQTQQSYVNLKLYHSNLSAVGLGSVYGMTAKGAIDITGLNDITHNVIALSKSLNLPIYPTVSDYNQSILGFDAAISDALLSDAKLFSGSIKSMVSLAVREGFAGIDLDFEAVQAKNKGAFAHYVHDLGVALHGQGKKLIISVPAKMDDIDPEYLAGYDYRALGNAVDYFQVMTYDQVGPGWSSGGFNHETWPGPESGADWQRAILAYAVSRMPGNKVLSGLPSYGYDYSTKDQVHWSDYQKVIAAHKALIKRDPASLTPYATWGRITQYPESVEWSHKTAQPILWFDDASSIATKARLVSEFKLGGTSVWAMGYENADFWAGLKQGLAQTK